MNSWLCYSLHSKSCACLDLPGKSWQVLYGLSYTTSFCLPFGQQNGGQIVLLHSVIVSKLFREARYMSCVVSVSSC